MFYQITDQIQSVQRDELSPDTITAGFITLTELKRHADTFGFSSATIARCEQENKHFRSSISVYTDYSFATVKIPGAHKNDTDSEDCIALYLARNLFLVVDIRDTDGSIKNSFEAALTRYPQSGLTMEKLVFAFLDTLIDQDSHVLEDLDFDIAKLEASIIGGKTDKQFPFTLTYYKKKVLLLRNYYEQLIDISEELLENENDVLGQEDLKYMQMFLEKVKRLCDNVLLLREELSQVRDANQATLDFKMNNVMKVLTVMSTVFLPLTLITSWYGMNFTDMPELDFRYGYPGVAVLCVTVAIVSIGYFKRRKWF